eukprot:PhM_4_TR16806/c2_g1_i3/m.52009
MNWIQVSEWKGESYQRLQISHTPTRMLDVDQALSLLSVDQRLCDDVSLRQHTEKACHCDDRVLVRLRNRGEVVQRAWYGGVEHPLLNAQPEIERGHHLCGSANNYQQISNQTYVDCSAE